MPRRSPPRATRSPRPAGTIPQDIVDGIRRVVRAIELYSQEVLREYGLTARAPEPAQGRLLHGLSRLGAKRQRQILEVVRQLVTWSISQRGDFEMGAGKRLDPDQPDRDGGAGGDSPDNSRSLGYDSLPESREAFGQHQSFVAGPAR